MNYLKRENTKQFLNQSGTQIEEPTKINPNCVTVAAMVIREIFTVPICQNAEELEIIKKLKFEKKWYEISKNELQTNNY